MAPAINRIDTIPNYMPKLSVPVTAVKHPVMNAKARSLRDSSPTLGPANSLFFKRCLLHFVYG